MVGGFMDLSDRVFQLQNELQAAKIDLYSTDVTDQKFDTTTEKIQAIQSEITQIITQWNQAAAQPKVNRSWISKLFTKETTSQEPGWITEAKHVQTQAAKVLQEKVPDIIYRKIQDVDPAKQEQNLATLSLHAPKNVRAIVQSYYSNIRKWDFPDHPIAQALLKVIITAAAHNLVGTKSIVEAVDTQRMQFAVTRDEKGKVDVHKIVGAGADAKIYKYSETIVMKVLAETREGRPLAPKEEREATQASHNEFRILPVLSGHANIVECHGVRSLTGKEGEKGLSMHLYEKGSFSTQIMLDRFAREVIKLSDAELDELDKKPIDKKRDFIEMKIIEANDNEALETFCKAVQIDRSTLIDKLATEYVPSNPARRESICTQLVNGQEFMREQAVLHGDIRPENILWEMKNGTPHLVFSDFGRSSFVNDWVSLLDLHDQFALERPVLDRQKVSSGTAGKMNEDNYAAVIKHVHQLFRACSETSNPKREQVLELNEAMKLFQKAGIFTRENDRHVPQREQLKIFYDLVLKQARKPTADEAGLLTEWEKAGLLTKAPNGTYRLAFAINEKTASKIADFANLLASPATSGSLFQGDIAYKNNNIMGWVVHFARLGDKENVQAALESYQRFMLGLSLYKMVTGNPPKLDQEGNVTETKEQLQANLKKLGLSDETTFKIATYLTPPANPFMKAQRVSTSLEETRDAIKKLEQQNNPNNAAEIGKLHKVAKELESELSKLTEQLENLQPQRM